MKWLYFIYFVFCVSKVILIKKLKSQIFCCSVVVFFNKRKANVFYIAMTNCFLSGKTLHINVEEFQNREIVHSHFYY